jgi:predicted lipid-binding transport protein (Tim44 family)
VQLNAELLAVEDRVDEYLASVRFSGLIRENVGAAAEPFTEIWNLTKNVKSGEGWLLAGIQQVTHH